MSVGITVNQTIPRKNLHSMHQDLCDWSIALQIKENNTSCQKKKVFSPSSSIHESISNFSNSYRPLSVSFQQWENSTKQAEDLSILHSEIASLANKLETVSKHKLALKLQNNNENSGNNTFLSINELESIIFSPSSELCSSESFDDPFSAKLDVVLISEENSLQFSYMETPPNSPSYDNLNISDHDVVEINKDSLHVIDKNLNSFDLPHFKHESIESMNDVFESSKVKEAELTSKIYERDDLLNSSKYTSISSSISSLAEPFKFEGDNSTVHSKYHENAFKVVDSANIDVSDEKQVPDQDFNQASDSEQNKNRAKDRVGIVPFSAQSSSCSSINEESELFNIEQENSYVTYEEKLEVIYNLPADINTTAKIYHSKNDTVQDDFPVLPPIGQLNDVSLDPENTFAESDTVVVEKIEFIHDTTNQLTSIDDDCHSDINTEKISLSSSEHLHKENDMNVEDDCGKTGDNEMSYKANSESVEVSKISQFSSSAVEELSSNQKGYADSSQASSQSQFEVNVVEEISLENEKNSSIEAARTILVQEKQARGSASEHYAPRTIQVEERGCSQLPTTGITVVESISIKDTNSEKLLKTILVEEQNQQENASSLSKTILVEEKQLDKTNENLAAETQLNLLSGETVSYESVCDQDGSHLKGAVEVLSNTNAHLLEKKSDSTRSELSRFRDEPAQKTQSNETTVDAVVVKKVILTPLNSPINASRESEFSDDLETCVLRVSEKEEHELKSSVKSKAFEQTDVSKKVNSNDNKTSASSPIDKSLNNDVEDIKQLRRKQIQEKFNSTSSSHFEKYNNVFELNKPNEKPSAVDKFDNVRNENLGDVHQQRSPIQSISLYEKEIEDKSKFQFMQKKRIFESHGNTASSPDQKKTTVRRNSYVQSAKAKSSPPKAVVSHSAESTPITPVNVVDALKAPEKSLVSVAEAQKEKTENKFTLTRPMFTAKPFNAAAKKLGHVAAPRLGVKERAKMFQNNIDSSSSPASPSSAKPSTISKSTSISEVRFQTFSSTKVASDRYGSTASLDKLPAVPPLPSLSSLAASDVLSTSELELAVEANDFPPPPIPALPDFEFDTDEADGKAV